MFQKTTAKQAAKQAKESVRYVDIKSEGSFVAEDLKIDKDIIPARFIEACKKYPENDALLYKKDHTFGQIKYKRLRNLVENFTLSLKKLGIKKGDKVVIISENRPEWVVADLSVISLGAVTVAIQKAFSEKQIKEIIKEIEPALYIVSDQKTFIKARNARNSVSRNEPIIFSDITQETEKEDNVDFISTLKLINHSDHSKEYIQTLSEVKCSDLASIIYTPSDDGKYKGVQLTHKNIVTNVDDTKEAIKILKSDRFMSVLPLSHALEKTAGNYVPLFSGAQIGYVTELSKFTEIAQRFKPTVIVGVPRLYEKTFQYAKTKFLKDKKIDILSKVAKPFIEKTLNARIKSSMGGEIRFLVSGGAPLKKEVGEFFSEAGMPMLEGYGLSEASPIVSVNRLEAFRFGTVGKPLSSVRVKIDSDGEILLKGPSITCGYFKNEKENLKCFDNGWLRTGDYGLIDTDNFLKITGKKKEVIVLSTGKKVSPVKIENKLKESRYIKQVIVVGDGQKNIAALIYPNYQEIEEEFSGSKKYFSFSGLRLNSFMRKEIEKCLADLSNYETIKKFRLTKEPLIEEKVSFIRVNVRNKIINKFDQKINAMYL